jgi:hypothetical protein
MSAALSPSYATDTASLAIAEQFFTLRRNGERPLAFAGSEVCSAMSYMPGTPLWYEVNIYRTAARGYVGYVRMFTKSEDDKDRFSGCEADSFEEIIHWLVSYEPAHDISASIPVDDPTVSAVELGIKAAAVSLKLAEARRQYADLLGEILYTLEKR